MYNYSSTTAILSILRALDNNQQIEVLGAFIENNLRKNMKYLSLIYVYEIIGPQIALALHNDKDKIHIASTTFYQYIKKQKKP